MAKIIITLEDTDEGLVAVETTIHGFDQTSRAQQMGDRINSYIAHIAQEKDKTEEPAVKPYRSKLILASG